MKIEKGMYAFSKNDRDYGIGTIACITEGEQGFKGDLVDIQYKFSKRAIPNQEVIASYNIIDLIEVGDYVNGYEVIQIDNGRLYFDVGDFSFNGIENNQIKSIVTKEQFESVSYKLKYLF